MKNSQNKNLNDFNLSSYGYPDKNGHYGIFGGTFVAKGIQGGWPKKKNLPDNNI